MATMNNPRIVKIDYTNWEGRRGDRLILPLCIQHRATEWHPEPQWLLFAFDLVKSEPRHFAMKDIHAFYDGGRMPKEVTLTQESFDEMVIGLQGVGELPQASEGHAITLVVMEGVRFVRGTPRGVPVSGVVKPIPAQAEEWSCHCGAIIPAACICATDERAAHG